MKYLLLFVISPIICVCSRYIFNPFSVKRIGTVGTTTSNTGKGLESIERDASFSSFKERCRKYKLNPKAETLPFPYNNEEIAYLELLLKAIKDEADTDVAQKNLDISKQKLLSKYRVHKRVHARWMSVTVFGVIVLAVALVNLGAGTQRTMSNISTILTTFLEQFKAMIRTIRPPRDAEGRAAAGRSASVARHGDCGH